MQFILPMGMAGIPHHIRSGIVEFMQSAQNRRRTPVCRHHVIPGIRI
ncbi:hypothetical protein HMPREF3038_02192, partial [Akkermansia sp. KLE1797]